MNFQEAANQTGIPRTHIFQIAKRLNPNYRRRSDGKRFVIKQESETPFAQIDGKEFFTIEEIEAAFGLTRTLFINQLLQRKTHILDSDDISHEVNWQSDEMAKCLDRLRQWKMNVKIQRKTHDKAHLQDDEGYIWACQKLD